MAKGGDAGNRRLTLMKDPGNDKGNSFELYGWTGGFVILSVSEGSKTLDIRKHDVEAKDSSLTLRMTRAC